MGHLEEVTSQRDLLRTQLMAAQNNVEQECQIWKDKHARLLSQLEELPSLHNALSLATRRAQQLEREKDAALTEVGILKTSRDNVFDELDKLVGLQKEHGRKLALFTAAAKDLAQERDQWRSRSDQLNKAIGDVFEKVQALKGLKAQHLPGRIESILGMIWKVL